MARLRFPSGIYRRMSFIGLTACLLAALMWWMWSMWWSLRSSDHYGVFTGNVTGTDPLALGRCPPLRPAEIQSQLPKNPLDWNAYDWDITYPKPVQTSDWINLLNRHAILQEEMCSGKRPLSALVLTCRQPCYAMGEGLNAFMTGYALAVVTERAYFINSPSHFPVETYFDLAEQESLLPGEKGTINWHVTDCQPLASRFELARKMGKDILPAPDAASHIPGIISPIIDARFNCEVLKQLAINTSLTEVLRNGNNLGVDCAMPIVNAFNKKHGFEAIGAKNHEPLFRSVFRRLFRFKQDTVVAVERYLRENHICLDRTVCFHVRTGAFFSDKVAKFKPDIKMKEFASCAMAVEKRVPRPGSYAGFSAAVPWILVSDKPAVSKSLLEAARELQPGRKRVLVDTEHAGIGPVRLLMESNMGGAGDNAKTRAQAVERILFDLYLLSQCQFLIAGQSGFAGMGELLGADWSQKKVFVAGLRMKGGRSDAEYVNGPCRRHPPASGQ
eukprot:scpid91122/ scgid11645/ 